MRSLYAKLMFDWETRMTTRDNNRVVRPFEWGVEWTRGWPTVNGNYPGGELSFEQAERYFEELNGRGLRDSEAFFGYETPTDFRLTTRVPSGERRAAPFLRFTSPVDTPQSVNNVVTARWFPAEKPSKRAVVVLPHWNSKVQSYNALCRIFAKLGISTLRMSLPYHDYRLPAETQRSDYAVSANVGRTIEATRQAIVDARSCFDWLEQQGYERMGIVGTSLGSCYAFLASAHDKRIRVNAFNHASTYFADVVWTGQSTRHVREGVEQSLDLERLRNAWGAISPMNYFDKFAGQDKKMLVIYATYDLTFLPQYSAQVVEEFRKRNLDVTVKVLPCGHYSTGETPFKFMDGWYLGSFLARNL
jgi:dienelactone hydrolase